MLRNDPPPGTQVKFLRDVLSVKANEIATLIRPLRKYVEDRPEDLFEVRHRDEIITVRRDQIE